MSRTSRPIDPRPIEALPPAPGIADRPSRRRAAPRRARDVLLRPRLLLEDPLLLACVLLMLCALAAAVGLVTLAP